MKTKNINGVIEEMTEKEYQDKLERGMKLEVIKEEKKIEAPKKEIIKKKVVKK